ncbi:glycerol-3-phosphate 1-O-acyltransferase PlsY [Bombella sp. ESL0378]|uniref:glycerol-3-phosphate 1-O-acyltransferase PlsY n=1 Tax=Bombella sp. ESL0378 TaxID=2676442 RepID=UPI001E43133E|nr:glycerol-3-phosphate 1-O-acyltransferase PlsY [Bombella sp. ESL0378]
MSSLFHWSLMPPSLLVIALAAYGIGSIPFGLLLTALSGQGDIRKIGSGNIGATNVLRTGRKGLAAATLLLDALKGLLAVLLAQALSPLNTALCLSVAGCAAVLGHCFPLWLGFRGGKGVATGIGVFWGMCWPVGLLCTILWLAGVRLSRISSVGALLAFLSAPFLMVAFSLAPILSARPIAATFITILILLRHHGNIARLINGTEPRISQK